MPVHRPPQPVGVWQWHPGPLLAVIRWRRWLAEVTLSYDITSSAPIIPTSEILRAVTYFIKWPNVPRSAAGAELPLISAGATEQQNPSVPPIRCCVWLAVFGCFVEFDLNKIMELIDAYAGGRQTVRHGAQVSGIRMGQAEEN